MSDRSESAREESSTDMALSRLTSEPTEDSESASGSETIFDTTPQQSTEYVQNQSAEATQSRHSKSSLGERSDRPEQSTRQNDSSASSNKSNRSIGSTVQSSRSGSKTVIDDPTQTTVTEVVQKQSLEATHSSLSKRRNRSGKSKAIDSLAPWNRSNRSIGNTLQAMQKVGGSRSETTNGKTHLFAKHEQNEGAEPSHSGHSMHSNLGTRNDRPKKSTRRSGRPVSKTSLGSTVQAVKSMEHKLKRQSWCPLLYLIALPLYTVLGGLIFKLTDGNNDDRLVKDFHRRCVEERNNSTSELYSMIKARNWTDATMFAALNDTITAVDHCLRRQETQPHPMSSYGASIRYSITIYTTLGSGKFVSRTSVGRVMTMFYALAGIPLFLAFTADWGLVFSNILNRVASYVEKHFRRWRSKKKKGVDDNEHIEQTPMQFKEKTNPENGDHLRELRRFGTVMVLLILYFFVVSAIVQELETIDGWTYMDALHFVFTSVALIGFGDLTASNDLVFILLQFPLICLGTTLIAMAYYFMQEKIRYIPARAHRSIKKYTQATHSIVPDDDDYDDATQVTVEIRDGEPLTPPPPPPPSTPSGDMTAYKSRSTCAILHSAKPGIYFV